MDVVIDEARHDHPSPKVDDASRWPDERAHGRSVADGDIPAIADGEPLGPRLNGILRIDGAVDKHLIGGARGTRRRRARARNRRKTHEGAPKYLAQPIERCGLG
jgi:hypothetical protein